MTQDRLKIKSNIALFTTAFREGKFPVKPGIPSEKFINKDSVLKDLKDNYMK